MRGRIRYLSETLFNSVGTHVPSHRLRQRWLKQLGATIGTRTAIFRGTTVLDAQRLKIGSHCAVGWRCVLDARGGLELGRNVSVASDVQLITADHNLNSLAFEPQLAPIHVSDNAWLASRATILKGVVIGEGGVVAAGAVCTEDVPPWMIAGGVPARVIGRRREGVEYEIDFLAPLW